MRRWLILTLWLWQTIACASFTSAPAFAVSGPGPSHTFGTLQGAGGVDGLLSVPASSTSVAHFAGYDGGGNVTRLVDGNSGQWSAHYEHGPFGEAIRETGPMAEANPFRRSTKFTDEGSGFSYYEYRYYNPSTGRWLNRDPIGEYGGFSLYGFVANNSNYYVDPLGLAYGDWWDPRTWFFDPDGTALPLPPEEKSYDYTEEEVPSNAGGLIQADLNGHRGSEIAMKLLTEPVKQAGCNLASTGTGKAVAAAGMAFAGIKYVNALRKAAKSGIHKNSLEYIGDTHVYRIKRPDGTTFMIGESARGVRAGDGLSIRVEEQVRRLQRETGDTFSSEIRKTFGSKAEARDYERRLIERFQRMYGEDALPGNKSYH